MQTWNEFEKEISAISDVEKEHIKQTARLVSQIAQRRRMLGLTQEEVAERAGLTQAAVGRLEKEGAVPRLDTLEKVAIALGLRLQLVTAEATEEAVATAGV